MSENRDRTPDSSAAAHRTEYLEEGITMPGDRERVGRAKNENPPKEEGVFENPDKI